MDLIEDNNAQFMLLAGFLIGIGLVITTVMLNSIMFEGNMAIESVTENSKYEMINLMQITTDEIRSAYRNSTEKGGTVQNATINFTQQVYNFSADLPKIYSMYGGGAKITFENWTNKGYANFTENGRPGGKDNWTIVENVNVNYLSIFNFTINLTGLIFRIEARNSTGYPVWSVVFNETKYNVSNATYPANYTIGDFTNGSKVNLSDSKYLFKNSVSSSPTVSIHIIYGSNAFGTYKIEGETITRHFTRERHYVLNTTIALSTAKVKANISMPVSVPW
ncbi:MAG: hypothetical protein Q7J35_10245 [Candidatus Methanoperedens sp.]|nr:hypothetical protein [Candidatus Methanoperedens sp.]